MDINPSVFYAMYYNAKERYNKNISTFEEKIDILENPNRANIEPILTIMYLT